MRAPWDTSGPVSQDPAGFPWELYDLSKDWTQSEDVAAKYPPPQAHNREIATATRVTDGLLTMCIP
jgi:hypothetical protein